MIYFDGESLDNIESYSEKIMESAKVYSKVSMRYCVFAWLFLIAGLGALYVGSTTAAVALLILAYSQDKWSDRYAHHVDMLNLHWSLASVIINTRKKTTQEILSELHTTTPRI